MGVAGLPSDEHTLAELVATTSLGWRLYGMPGVLEILFRTRPCKKDAKDKQSLVC